MGWQANADSYASWQFLLNSNLLFWPFNGFAPDMFMKGTKSCCHQDDFFKSKVEPLDC